MRAFVLAALCALLLPFSAHAKEAEWTILVYMNGKNNLEPNALENFHDMAEVGSNSGVNIVVELGRPKTVRYTHEDGDWTGVKRFLVKKDSSPVPDEALMDLEAKHEPIDMGKVDTLTRFIMWGKQAYPAKHYMLIIWNHGQGWRFQLAKTTEARVISTSRAADAGIRAGKVAAGEAVRTLGGYRAVSQDDDSNNILYNYDIQAAMSDAFSPAHKLDILGFDACLMGMLETAYGFADKVSVMVASEELEPGEGWYYAPWLKALEADSTMPPEKLAADIVASYADRYKNHGLTTLSAMQLSNIKPTAHRLSEFADDLVKAGNSELRAMKAARRKLSPYGGDVGLNTSIDLVTLLQEYEKQTKNAALKARSADLRKALLYQVPSNYASTRSAKPPQWLPHGSRGVAIYFPATKQDFEADPWHVGYLKSNRDKPVTFVQNESWPQLLYRILGL